MSPEFFFFIMGRTTNLSTSKTGKSTSLGKIQMNIQTFPVNIKSTLRYLPWGVGITQIG